MHAARAPHTDQSGAFIGGLVQGPTHCVPLSSAFRVLPAPSLCTFKVQEEDGIPVDGVLTPFAEDAPLSSETPACGQCRAAVLACDRQHVWRGWYLSGVAVDIVGLAVLICHAQVHHLWGFANEPPVLPSAECPNVNVPHVSTIQSVHVYPNCGLGVPQERPGRYRRALYAIRSIAQDEEIFWCYGHQYRRLYQPSAVGRAQTPFACHLFVLLAHVTPRRPGGRCASALARCVLGD